MLRARNHDDTFEFVKVMYKILFFFGGRGHSVHIIYVSEKIVST